MNVLVFPYRVKVARAKSTLAAHSWRKSITVAAVLPDRCRSSRLAHALGTSGVGTNDPINSASIPLADRRRSEARGHRVGVHRHAARTCSPWSTYAHQVTQRL